VTNTLTTLPISSTGAGVGAGVLYAEKEQGKLRRQ